MKSTPLLFVALLAASGFACSQDEPTSARILGTIPDGTPPPSAPKPQFNVSANDVLETTTREQGGRTVTLRKIKPIALPPPAPPATVEPDREFTANLAEYREAHPASGLLILSATIYRSGSSSPRTLVHYWPERGGETITFWSSADFALVSGIQSFIDTAGGAHSLIMGWGYVDLNPGTDGTASQGSGHDDPEIPNFPEGKASFQISGKQPTAEDFTAIQSLHDLYNREFQQLLTAHQGRELARLRHEAELKANPPKPHNITLNYWRSEKPASTKGGAR